MGTTKKCIFILVALLSTAGLAAAQSDDNRVKTEAATATFPGVSSMEEEPLGDADEAFSRFDDSALQRIMPTRYGGRSRKYIKEEAPADSLNLPAVNRFGQPTVIGRYPLGFGGWYSWGLHKGLNVQIGASVFGQFGKGAHSGVGFQQDIALMYAMPINDKLSVAVGGYLNNVNFAGSNCFDAGVQAMIGYRFNEHWEAYLYGQKTITNNYNRRLNYSLWDCGFGSMGGFSRNFYGMPSYSLYDLNNFGDRIGATVRYNFNNSMSIEVTVENRWLPSPR